MKTLYTIGLFVAVVGNVQAAAVTPKITKISVTPTSAPAGTMFKFTAELDNPLPTGYKAKIKLNKKLIPMIGQQTTYAFSEAIYTIGKQNYRIGIYDAKNVLQGKTSNGNYTVTTAALKNHIPTLSLVKAENTATTNTAYTVTFNAKDVDGNLSSITMNWGDNSEPETLTATDSKDLTFSHIYTSASSFGWNAFASDKGTPVLNSKSISKIVTVSNPEPIEVKGDIETFVSGSKTFSYTKIANDGSELPKTAKLGTGAKDWACTKDNNTGLIWEVKTDDGSLRDLHNLYGWYEPDAGKNGGWEGVNLGYYNSDDGKLYKCESCNTHAYVKAVNQLNLCSARNWRMPTYLELNNLIYCSDNKYNKPDYTNYNYICAGNNGANIKFPAINTTYFPDVQNLQIMGWFWSSSFYSNGSDYSWLIGFGYGTNLLGAKTNGAYIRLVRNAQ